MKVMMRCCNIKSIGFIEVKDSDEDDADDVHNTNHDRGADHEKGCSDDLKVRMKD